MRGIWRVWHDQNGVNVAHRPPESGMLLFGLLIWVVFLRISTACVCPDSCIWLLDRYAANEDI